MKIIIIRYLYASVIRSVKFRDNEVSLASQRRNTSHFRSKLRLPWEAKTNFSLFWNGIGGLYRAVSKFTMDREKFSESRGEIHLFREETIVGRIFEKNNSIFPYFPQETLRILKRRFLRHDRCIRYPVPSVLSLAS